MERKHAIQFFYRVSTAAMVFQKGGITDNVWFYDMGADGFTLDDKRNKTDKNDIPDIIAKWKTRHTPNPSQEGNKIVRVNVTEIRDNKYDLSICRYKKIEYEEVKYEKPDVIMNKVLKLEKEIETNIEQIKKMIRNG